MRAMNSTSNATTRLSVSIVLYNSPLDLLERVLQSLYRSALAAQRGSRVGSVVVDVVDNSTDPQSRRCSREALESWRRTDVFRVIYHEMPENCGFGAGHNRAIRSADSDFHLVLNPDAELAEDALSVGLASLEEDASIVLVSPRVLSENGAQEFLCKRYPSFIALLLRAFGPRLLRRLFRRRLHRYEMRDVCSGDEEADVLLASGCFMLARTAALKSVGGFNDTYFLYFEDFDLSIRMGGRGRLVFNPAMQIVHHGGYAASKGIQHVKYFIRSGITFFGQHGWRWI
jgi:GT2 family glycosyltransferase